MKTKLVKRVTSCSLFACALVSLIAAATLGSAGIAQAQRPESPQAHCDVHMLRGLYLWTFEGYQYFGGIPVPKNSVAGIRFNGDGTEIEPFGTVNVGGTVTDPSGTEGTYTVAADCTGTLTIAGGFATFNMYVGPGAQQLWIIQTGGGVGDGYGLATGTAKRVER